MRYDGAVVRPRGEGDSRFAVFARATDAIAAAYALQQALHVEPWPTSTPLQVRLALHTGEADLRDGDYYGAPVNRCARLRAVAHGGQILLSRATYDLVRDQPLPGVAFRALGEHRLKDLIRPEQIFQLVIPGLPADFPALISLESQPNNLPLQATPLIGREREVTSVRNMLARVDVRLLTLTGPGGTGKTRLGLQAAAELLDAFADGVFFVALAPISDPGLVTTVIARALGVKEAGAWPLLDSLKDYLREKHLLLLLDNFEQVVEAAPLVAELLEVVPDLKALVTSRAALHLAAEHEFAVPPLALPDRTPLPPLERLMQYEAVRLFIARAQAVKADFAVTNANAPAVAEICHRLDGLPLPIELATARIKLFPPQALLARLDNRLKLLTGGSRDLPARQQTIRATIDWSYDLLGAGEQTLFARLGVFVGGCTLEAAEAVCNAEHDLPMEVMDGMAALLDQSLLRQEEGTDGEPRFTLLETIREYAREQLDLTREIESIRRRHANYFLALAEQAEPELSGGPDQISWYHRLQMEHDNLRAALQWSLTQEQAALGLRLSGALWWFWLTRGYLNEGRQWLTKALATTVPVSSSVRGKALHGAGSIALDQRDFTAATALFEQALTIARELQDRGKISTVLYTLGEAARLQGDLGLFTPMEQKVALRKFLTISKIYRPLG